MTVAPAHMPPPRLVIFDMDDVLLRYDVEARRAAMGALAGLSAADVERLVWDSGIESASDLGHLTPDAYLAVIAQALGVPFGHADWLRTRALAMTLDPAVLALVDEVRAHTPIALLTNNGHIMRAHFDVLVPELRARFGPAMHVACEFGAKKPTPSVYKGIATLYGVAPREAVMIDDKPVNIAGAREAGLRAHCFTRATELAHFLRAHHMVA
ncbi:HAD-IA family hydrolase [Ancylobacter vacuolatus]|uniref:Hydrolase of the HAD superfamily n=1 Tax=Ancylobacter vacuolatus TaxID=223389 RepID=A0ABU0DFU4_9HYPH|nr:HAD-IA family hydrolase [Ancylobacter vacuolatus]MDQ0347296.1 putative hydrolase of the HAD superfamily [Ancylobacter vacuolatus]